LSRSGEELDTQTVQKPHLEVVTEGYRAIAYSIEVTLRGS